MGAPLVARLVWHVGEGRLEGEVLHEFHILADGVVDAVATADDGVFEGMEGEAEARREIVALGVDEVVRIFAVEGTDAVGRDDADLSEVVAGIERGEAVVLFRVGRVVVVAKADEEGGVFHGAPVVLRVAVDLIGTEMRFLVGGLERGFLRQAEEQIGERGAAGGEAVAAGAAGCAGRLGGEAGEDVGAGGVGVADHVVVDAAEVAAEADVVLAVVPDEHVVEADGFCGLEVRLLLVEAAELIERDVGQAPQLRRVGQAIEAELRGDVGEVARSSC